MAVYCIYVTLQYGRSHRFNLAFFKMLSSGRLSFSGTIFVHRFRKSLWRASSWRIICPWCLWRNMFLILKTLNKLTRNHKPQDCARCYTIFIELCNPPHFRCTIHRHFRDSSEEALSEAPSCSHDVSRSEAVSQQAQVLCHAPSYCSTTVAEEGQTQGNMNKSSDYAHFTLYHFVLTLLLINGLQPVLSSYLSPAFKRALTIRPWLQFSTMASSARLAC